MFFLLTPPSEWVPSTPSTAERLLPGDAKPWGERGRAEAEVLACYGGVGARGSGAAGLLECWCVAACGGREQGKGVRRRDRRAGEGVPERRRGQSGEQAERRALVRVSRAGVRGGEGRGEQWIGLMSDLMGWASGGFYLCDIIKVYNYLWSCSLVL